MQSEFTDIEIDTCMVELLKYLRTVKYSTTSQLEDYFLGNQSEKFMIFFGESILSRWNRTAYPLALKSCIDNDHIQCVINDDGKYTYKAII